MTRTMTVAPARRPHEPGAAVRRTDRAQLRASSAISRTPSKTLAAHFGVSESRARHFRTDDPSGPVTKVLGLIADPSVDAGPIVAAVLSSFEERFLFAPTADLRARLAYLRETEEHRLEAEQNRAMVVNDPNRADAYRAHAAALIELATIEELLR